MQSSLAAGGGGPGFRPAITRLLPLKARGFLPRLLRMTTASPPPREIHRSHIFILLSSLHRRPHAVHILVFIQRVQEFADFLLLGFGQFGQNFWNVADFAGDDGPPVG